MGFRSSTAIKSTFGLVFWANKLILKREIQTTVSWKNIFVIRSILAMDDFKD